MGKKLIVAVFMVVVMTLGVVNVYAIDYYVPDNATRVTTRFFVIEDDADSEFTMLSEDGNLTISITDSVIIYFEGFVPLSDECDGVTQMVRDVLFGRSLAEVLDGRNMRVILDEQGEAISVKILFETAVHLPQEIALPAEILLVVNGNIIENAPPPLLLFQIAWTFAPLDFFRSVIGQVVIGS